MWARWYDPGVAQFISVDPELAATQQPYAYANNNPTNQTDPTGPITVGVCGSSTLGFNLSVSDTECLTRLVTEPDGKFHAHGMDLVSSPAAAAGLDFGASAGLLWDMSNAPMLEDLAGLFVFVGFSGEIIAGEASSSILQPPALVTNTHPYGRRIGCPFWRWRRSDHWVNKSHVTGLGVLRGAADILWGISNPEPYLQWFLNEGASWLTKALRAYGDWVGKHGPLLIRSSDGTC